MGQFAIHLLGPWQVQRDAAPVTEFRHDKMRALLAYLVVEAERPHRRESLAGLLWPDQPERAALHNLRQSLLLIRQALGDDDAARPLIAATTKTVAFHGQGRVGVDVAEFTRLVEACATHPHRRLASCRVCHQRLVQAARVYQGEFLAGLSLPDCVSFEEWRLVMQERLHRQALETFSRLAVYHERRAEYARAADMIRRLLALEPWHEEAHRDLMRLLAWQGARSAAIAQYNLCRRALETELGVAPGRETVTLFEQIQAEGLTPPPLRTPYAPLPPTRLLGREADIAQLTERLADPACRLLTLVGPPGVGKTRLGLHMAWASNYDFEQGVVFVELAQAHTPDAVLSGLAQALDIREGEGLPLLARVKAALRDQERLLVLDNFESALAAAPLVADLLAVCPHLTVLATSRVALRLRAERQFPVTPLTLPLTADRQLLTADDVFQLATYPAIALFVERAEAVAPRFALDSANAEDVAEIVSRLDGLPLAIELVATRADQMPLPTLRAQLDRRLRVLTEGPLDMPAHHQTLQAALAWSYDLLSAEAQTVFARLGVFAGGASLAAVEAVCDLRLPDAETSIANRKSQIDNSLSALVDHHLLRQVATEPEPRRYVMLETLREYALDRLGEDAEATVARQRHAAFFVQLAFDAYAQRMGAEQGVWLQRIAADQDNVRAALTWTMDHDPAAALTLGTTFGWFCHVRGYLSEGRRWLAQVIHGAGVPLPTTDATLDEAQRQQLLAFSRPLTWAGILAAEQGDYAAAQVPFDQTARIFRALGDQSNLVGTLSNLGNLAWYQGDYPAAWAYLEEALGMDRAAGETGGIAASLGNLGLVALAEGNADEARGYQEESLDLYRALGDTYGLSVALHELGDTVCRQGDFGHARTLYEESLALRRDMEDKPGIAATLAGLGEVAYRQSDVGQAKRLYRESLRLCREIEDLKGITIALEKLASLAATQGQTAQAARWVGAAAALRDQSGGVGRQAPADQADYTQQVARLRAALGVTQFETEWGRGRAAPLDHVLAEALA